MLCKEPQDVSQRVASSLLGWRASLVELVSRDPLFEAKSSLSALASEPAGSDAPLVVTLGVGVCSARGTISRGVPLDLVGLVLSAERVRSRLDAHRVIALVVDAHAARSGVPSAAVAAQTARVEDALLRLSARCRIPLSIVRGSDLHRTREHARARRAVTEIGGAELADYVMLQTADTHALGLRYGRILKLGWSLGGVAAERDERFFDRLYRRWLGSSASFVYTRAGLTLSRERPRAAPYVVVQPEARLLCDANEDPGPKLEGASRTLTPDRVRAVRNHYARLARAYSRLGTPLEGPLERRLTGLLDDLFPRVGRELSAELDSDAAR